jgi:hypothetical protein
MARNANNQPAAGGSQGSGVEQDYLDGTYPARIVQVVFLGVQEQRAFQGQAKPDIDKVRVTYELSHEWMKDAEGNELKDKPRWYSEELAFHNATSDLATSTKRYKAYNSAATSPADHVWGDVLLGTSVNVQLKSRKVEQGKSAGKTFTDVKGVTQISNMPGYTQPELVNPATFFDPADDGVSVEAFNTFPQWLQDVIKGAKDYGSSALSKALSGAPQSSQPAPSPAPTPAPQAPPSPAAKDVNNPY